MQKSSYILCQKLDANLGVCDMFAVQTDPGGFSVLAESVFGVTVVLIINFGHSQKSLQL